MKKEGIRLDSSFELELILATLASFFIFQLLLYVTFFETGVTISVT